MSEDIATGYDRKELLDLARELKKIEEEPIVIKDYSAKAMVEKKYDADMAKHDDMRKGNQ